jgi:hypothetical protein
MKKRKRRKSKEEGEERKRKKPTPNYTGNNILLQILYFKRKFAKFLQKKAFL